MNIDAVKNRLKSLQNSNNRTSHLWKPTPGEHKIRIVPYAHNPENAFIEMYFHYNLGKKSTLSPISFNRPDPIVEFAEKLKQTGDKEDWLMGRKLEPKMRTYVPVLVRGKEKEGVKFWGFGKQIYQELLEIISDPDYGDITDLKNGHDITVTVKSAEEAGRDFAETSIRIRPTKSPATTDADIVAKIREQPSITELYPEPSYEDLKTQLHTWMGTNEDTVEEIEVPATPSTKPTKSAMNEEVEKAFDDLFAGDK